MGIYMGKHTNFVDTNAHTVIFWKDEICEIIHTENSHQPVMSCRVRYDYTYF